MVLETIVGFNFRWKKGVKIRNSGNIRVISQGVLIISRIREQQAGKYTCRAVGQGGVVREASAWITVIVPTPTPPCDIGNSANVIYQKYLFFFPFLVI